MSLGSLNGRWFSLPKDRFVTGFPLPSCICWDMLSCRHQHWCTAASSLPGQDGFVVFRALLMPQMCCCPFSSHLHSMQQHRASGIHPLSTPATRTALKHEAQQNSSCFT